MMIADAPAWAAWANVTAIVVSVPAGGFARVRIPQAIAPDADGSYADLRVIDDAGREVPYAVDPLRSASPSRDVPVTDVGFFRGTGTQGVADLGTSGSLEDSITLTIDAAARPTYFESVDIDASDDRRVWRSIRSGALVYRVEQDRGRGNQTISFLPTRSRWLRIRIRNARIAFPLIGASVARSAAELPGFVPYAFPLKPVPAAAANDRAWRVDAGVALRPAAVRFTARGNFSRAVTVAVSDDGSTWEDLGTDSIARFADGSSHLEFAFTERTAKHVRITMANGNDAPADAVPVLLAAPHYAVFATTPGATYRFLSENETASVPSYDLADRLAHQAWIAVPGSAGITARNATIDALPATERYPWLLTAGIVAVALALGGLALATIRSANVTE